MKALHVLHRLCHYFMVWDFILGGLATAFGVFYLGMGVLAGYSLDEVSSLIYLAGGAGVILVALGILMFAFSHTFKMAARLRAKRAEMNEEYCGCGCECHCCECEKEEKSDLDNQVEEVMKWKNLYVEGIITEREFIDKRNEILRLSK